MLLGSCRNARILEFPVAYSTALIYFSQSVHVLIVVDHLHSLQIHFGNPKLRVFVTVGCEARRNEQGVDDLFTSIQRRKE